jgi:hypothetical protein
LSEEKLPHDTFKVARERKDLALEAQDPTIVKAFPPPWAFD